MVDTTETEQFLRGQVDPPIRGATGLSATIDGVSVPDIKARYFEDSVLFSVTVPAENIFGLPGGTLVGPSADAGYYLMVLHFRPVNTPSTSPARFPISDCRSTSPIASPCGHADDLRADSRR